MSRLNREPVILTIESGVTSTVGRLANIVSRETSANLVTPDGLSGTELSFLVSLDGVNFYPFHNPDDNSAVTVAVDSSAKGYWLEPVKFYGLPFIKIISNATETDKTFQIVTYNV